MSSLGQLMNLNTDDSKTGFDFGLGVYVDCRSSDTCDLVGKSADLLFFFAVLCFNRAEYMFERRTQAIVGF